MFVCSEEVFRIRVPMSLGSDTHYADDVGDFSKAERIVRKWASLRTDHKYGYYETSELFATKRETPFEGCANGWGRDELSISFL